MTSPLVALDPADENEIRRVIMKYARAVDRCDVELMLEAYHEDAIDDHGSFRLPAAEAVGRIVQATRRSQVSQHHMTNILIDVIDADTVQVETYATCFLVEDADSAEAADSGVQLRSLGLRYIDRMERRDRWAIVVRRVVHDWSSVTPITNRWATASKLPQGRRDRGDLAYAREL
jgi:ketosteroid isomerase-like protein